MRNQRTIEKQVGIEGVGLHTGSRSRIVFNPAPPDSGILVVRTDVAGAAPVRAEIDNLLGIDRSPRRTTIVGQAFQVHTVEHMLSALFALGVDNVLVEIEGEECPGLDGSSASFVEIIRRAGVREQEETEEEYRLKEPIYISENGSHIVALPNDRLRVSYTLDYPNSPIRSQYASFMVDAETYEREIAPARTFCLEDEVERLRKLGLGKGSDYTNTLVIGKSGVINNTFRFDDEPVRHKIADLIGDLALLGRHLSAHIIGIRSGHALNAQLIKKIRDLSRKEKVAGIGAPTMAAISSDTLDIEQIESVIPHRYPFLLVDKILQIEEDRKAVGIKNVTMNEWFFQGHFPGRPVMPGVLIIEAMAQVGGVLMLSKKENRGKLAYFMSIDRVKFRRTVRPGDQLVMEVEVSKLKSKVGQINGKTYVDGKLAAEASLMFTVADA